MSSFGINIHTTPSGVNSIFPLVCKYLRITLRVLWFTLRGSFRFISATLITCFDFLMVSSTICTVSNVGLCNICGGSKICFIVINM